MSCAKTHLQQSIISLFKGTREKGKGGEECEGKRMEGGRGRIGKGWEGRKGTGKGRREGREEWGWWGGDDRGARHGLSPRDNLWFRR